MFFFSKKHGLPFDKPAVLFYPAITYCLVYWWYLIFNVNVCLPRVFGCFDYVILNTMVGVRTIRFGSDWISMTQHWRWWWRWRWWRRWRREDSWTPKRWSLCENSGNIPIFRATAYWNYWRAGPGVTQCQTHDGSYECNWIRCHTIRSLPCPIYISVPW